MPVDISQFQRSVLSDAVNKAQQLEANGNYHDAALAYERAAEHAEFFAKNTAELSLQRQRAETGQSYRKRAEELRKFADNSTISRHAAIESDGTQPDADEFRLSARRLVHKTNIGLDDVAGLAETKKDIQSAFALAMAKAPVGVQLPRPKSFLFYGPPGCGKTLLAAAISHSFGATFFNVKVGDLLSRYFGDSPKLVQALFEEARSHDSSVIFLDEFDALAQSRSGGDSTADRRLLVSLLTELDGLREKGGDDGVLTIAATNRPWDLDEAILSRFEKLILIPLPDAETRRRLLRLSLEERGYQVDADLNRLVESTDGYSGREIEQLCKRMIEAMTHEANPNLLNVANQGADALKGYAIQVKPITTKHLTCALKSVNRRTSQDGLKQFERWAKHIET